MVSQKIDSKNIDCSLSAVYVVETDRDARHLA